MPASAARIRQTEAAPDLEGIRREIRLRYMPDETAEVRRLADGLSLSKAARKRISEQAGKLVHTLRHESSPGLMEIFLAEYGLSTKEGVALMCLAEALLRVPDDDNIDALIADKIAPADWGKHVGHSASPLVNASTWALMLTGKVIGPGEKAEWDVMSTLHGLIRRMGEPVIRTAIGRAIRIMGHQFVLGQDIAEAMRRAREYEAKGYTYSYDMLGEAARTAQDARRYYLSYSAAITDLAERAKDKDIRNNPGISVKLSALHPRYEYGQRERIMDELVPRLTSLALLAKNANMGLNVDAEEMDRLDLSLEVIEAVLSNSDLKGWDGFGVVVQAYAPRAPFVLDWLYALAERLDRRIMVRLVKGAYWDMEVKRAQVMGLERFPVFTRKVSTDLCYLACAEKLFGMIDRIYPQFATHNAHTVAAVLEMAGDSDAWEFQRLHGMGEALHEEVREKTGRRCRIYAPVGIHRDLLAYLVRRLLENGANSSFVNQVLDEDTPIEEIVADPVEEVRSLNAVPNPMLPLPPDLYGEARRNSKGWDLTDPVTVAALDKGRNKFRTHRWEARPLLGGKALDGTPREMRSPQNKDDLVGTVYDADKTAVDAAFAAAEKAGPAWRELGAEKRAKILEKIADLYEKHAPELMAIASREAGKSLLDGVAEVREAVDFCRYYAAEARRLFGKEERAGRGVFVCISPWNFPLAIFTGQIAAALVTGNAVLAKPAEQSPLIAARAVALMHEAGVPGDVLHLLPGDGPTVGAALTGDRRASGICFTGGLDTASIIHKAMAEADNAAAPLIAETGGLNAMIVDSTALPEQAVRDIVISAFQSAGQRCSALRVLCVQEDIADGLTELLKGAMDELGIGDPWDLSTDTGPVIDEDARETILKHCEKMEADGRLIHKVTLPKGTEKGTFVAPAAYRLDKFDDLEREVFGPILHVLRFKASEIGKLVETINASGYGLTFGLHTRIDTRVQEVCDAVHAGNAYVNRNQIGAIVGVQPFGGEGLSGTGPKAGGPHYLKRFTAPAANWSGGNGEAAQQDAIDEAALAAAISAAAKAQPKWAAAPDRLGTMRDAAGGCEAWIAEAIEAAIETVAAEDYGPVDLPGPTGESNQLTLHPRGVYLCLGAPDGDGAAAARQAALALAAGNGVVLTRLAPGVVPAVLAAGAPKGIAAYVPGRLPPALIESLSGIQGIVAHPEDPALPEIRRALARREGPILPLVTDPGDMGPFVFERALCVDTTAAGGNATLLAAVGQAP